MIGFKLKYVNNNQLLPEEWNTKPKQFSRVRKAQETRDIKECQWLQYLDKMHQRKWRSHQWWWRGKGLLVLPDFRDKTLIDVLVSKLGRDRNFFKESLGTY